jgi:hypothetical protein
MIGIRIAHRSLAIVASVAGLAACSVYPQMPAIAPVSSIGAGARTTAGHTGGPLLYIAHIHGQGRHAHSVISIWSLRQGKAIARIAGREYVTGICSDASGNVWVSNLRRGDWFVDEYARGGTKAIEELRAPKRWLLLAGCAVDPDSGDLAVLGANIDNSAYVLVWSGAREGTPARYPAPFPLLNAAYDNAGNLFITGWAGGSDFFFEMGELAKGGSQVTRIQLDKPTREPGDVHWDGTYVAVSTAISRNRTRSRIYRVKVSGANAHVVQVVQLQDFSVDFYSTLLFVLHDRSVIGIAGGHGEDLRTWPYPAGGNSTRSIAEYERINGLTISD